MYAQFEGSGRFKLAPGYLLQVKLFGSITELSLIRNFLQCFFAFFSLRFLYCLTMTLISTTRHQHCNFSKRTYYEAALFTCLSEACEQFHVTWSTNTTSQDPRKNTRILRGFRSATMVVSISICHVDIFNLLRFQCDIFLTNLNEVWLNMYSYQQINITLHKHLTPVWCHAIILY